MTNQLAFQRQFPNVLFLSIDNKPELEQYLRNRGAIAHDEGIVSLGIPGEGNMNCVVRVITQRKQFILKQSRPWVEKYPQIAAPIQRIEIEAAYYRAVQKESNLAKMSPQIHWYDDHHFLLSLEDLGPAADFSHLYRSSEFLRDDHLSILMQYLNQLHSLGPVDDFPNNLSMRRLNHEHIFHFPFLQDNGMDLDTITLGLADAAEGIKADQILKDRIKRYGEIYLSEGPSLLHGDFYPGSWLWAKEKIYVIDPEFSFQGAPEFDLGVLIAHLFLSQQETTMIKTITSTYAHWQVCKQEWLAAFAGIEILRRLLGVAQLPLALSLTTKQTLIEAAREWIMAKSVPW